MIASKFENWCAFEVVSSKFEAGVLCAMAGKFEVGALVCVGVMARKFEVGVYVGVMASKFEVGECLV